MNVDDFIAKQKTQLQIERQQLGRTHPTVESKQSPRGASSPHQHFQLLDKSNRPGDSSNQDAVDLNKALHVDCIGAHFPELQQQRHAQRTEETGQAADKAMIVNREKFGGNPDSKTAKELANINEQRDDELESRSRHRMWNDMDQPVSDTFYSYFPGFSNELKKRQELLRERQLENQQNFLKHKVIEASLKKGKYHDSPHEDPNRSSNTPRSNKTDLEIIVNNPDYGEKSPRPGSARYKLLQDLKHTEIARIVNSDAVLEINRQKAEVELAKKKDYQKELMNQIEEKRRAIEDIKEKERRQEELLTRKLQEQLKSIRLEEELEKERLRVEKLRFDSEQNRLMREHLLSKLESDINQHKGGRKARSESEKTTPIQNKVYKYFSNSARHEYKRGDNTESPPFQLDLPAISPPFKKCFHSDANICPVCGSLLDVYNNWCLKCIRRVSDSASEGNARQMICHNCKRLYTVCGNCKTNDKDKSMGHQNKEDICENCRRIMCMGSLRDDSRKSHNQSPNSFEILEVNYDAENDENLSNNRQHNDQSSFNTFERNLSAMNSFTLNNNKLFGDDNNIEQIRHATEKRLSKYLKNYGDLTGKILRDRSTQTVPEGIARRDVVVAEDNSLSMPLLREMPKMSRDSDIRKKDTPIDSLARKWEVPAVQKLTISSGTPKVLTQLGAFRKQLQYDELQNDY